MKLAHQIKLTTLFDIGYIIQIPAGPYVSGNVNSIGKLDYDVDNSPYVYSDDHMQDRELSFVSSSDVKVLMPIDWTDPKYDDNYWADQIPDTENFLDHDK